MYCIVLYCIVLYCIQLENKYKEISIAWHKALQFVYKHSAQAHVWLPCVANVNINTVMYRACVASRQFNQTISVKQFPDENATNSKFRYKVLPLNYTQITSNVRKITCRIQRGPPKDIWIWSTTSTLTLWYPPYNIIAYLYSYLPSHYITVTQFQYILTISIVWEFATN